MIRRAFYSAAGLILAALLAAFAALPAIAAEASAKAFVETIYRAYVGKGAKGVNLSTPKARALLTPELAKLIDLDRKQAARRGDAPELDGDPFIDAQDFDIKSYTVAIEDTGSDRAIATVTFNPGAVPDKPVALDLVKTKNGWRIDDFRGPSGSVRQFLSKKK